MRTVVRMPDTLTRSFAHLASARSVLLRPGMGHPLRWNRTDLVYEVTLETIQGRYLLRPSREVRDLILGVISRAQARYPAINLYAFVFTRDRGVLLLSTADEAQFSSFMAYVAGGISRKLGRLLDWSGKLWAGRYRSAPILDEDAINQRLRATLALGVDEGLVASPRDWPGASCVPALLGPMTLDGVWVDRDREAALRRGGLEPPASAYVRPYRVTLTPIPGWADLPRAEQVARYQAMIESIEHEHLMSHRGKVVDAVELQRQDPFFRPPPTGARLRRLCHATTAALATGFRAAYRGFCAAFRAAASAIVPPSPAKAALVAGFPPGSAPRPDLRVPVAVGRAAPWWCEAPVAPPPDEVTVADDAVTGSGTERATIPWPKVRRPHRPRRSAPPPPPAPPPAPPTVAQAGRRAPVHRRPADRPTRALADPRPPG